LNLLTAARSQGRIDVVIIFLLFGGDVVGLSVAIPYGTSKRYAPTRNLITIIESCLWWHFVVITLLSKMLNQLAFLVVFSSLLTPYENRQLRLTQPHRWERLLFHCLKTYLTVLFFETLPTYHFERVFPRLFVGSPFSPTLSQSEGTMIALLLSIVFNGLS
jgi:hypothetical protein